MASSAKDSLSRAPAPASVASTPEGPTADVRVQSRGYRRGEFYCEVATSLPAIEPHLAAWEDLERRSLEDNFYLSPDMLMATLRHVGGEHPYYVVFVYKREDGGNRLVGCAPFSLLPATLRVPVQTLASFTSTFTYLSGPLLDREHAASAVAAIWDWIERPRQPWRLVVLQQMSDRSRVWHTILNELDRRGCQHWVKETARRAKLKRGESFETFIGQWSSSRRKGYRRRLRRLERLGTVEVVAHRRLDRTPDLARRFMDLEASGWKGRDGTALAQSPSGSAFFSEVIGASARRGRLFFVELRLNARPVAMTSNFILGHTMFGFKVAFDPEFEDVSPGTLVEVETIRKFHEVPELLVADSGTSGPSYLDPIWRDHTMMQVVYVSTSHLASEMCIRAIPAATYAKRAVSSGLNRLRGSRRSEAYDA